MSWHASHRAHRRRGRRFGCVVAGIALAIVVVAVLAGVVLIYGRGQLDAPRPGDSHSVTVTITRNESLSGIVDDLDNHHVIQSHFWFSLYARYRGLADNAVAGPHDVSAGMGASAVVAALESAPDIKQVSVTFPEGLTARQMGARLEQAATGITAQAYLNEVEHGSFTEPFLSGRPAGVSLEGFLFPDTYAVPQGTTAHQFVQMQLDDFAKRAAPALAPAHGSLSPYQTLTLASIVEREARFAEDRPLVAGVLANRLRDGMLLQADATVTYGLGRAGEPSAADLKQDTPYNTYLHAGLPPTPISNPGVASIEAAVSPAQTPYLFYVSDCSGHNHYARTNAEQERNIQTYLGKPCS